MTKKRPFIPYDKQLLEKARENRKNPTPAEKKMWFEVLGNNGFQNLKFTRQKPIDQFIVDFCCSKLLLAIEIDGDSHVDQLEYDQQRTERLSQYGITVIRYLNDDVMHHIDGVYRDLLEKVNRLEEGQKITP